VPDRKFPLQPHELAAALVGAVLIGLLDRWWDGYSWSRTLITMGMFFVFLCAVYYWVRRRRDRSDQARGGR
jgi:hypothetical protein